ncbi:MAG TPA: hypothetical protein VGC41_25085 [Kofleriaceae bacterium]
MTLDRTCTLELARYVGNDAWAELALPDLLDKTEAQAIALMGPSDSSKTDYSRTLRWYRPGAEAGGGGTVIEADVFGGQVDVVTAAIDAGGDVLRPLNAAVANRLKSEPKPFPRSNRTDEDQPVRFGTSKVTSHYESTRGRFVVEQSVGIDEP